MEKFIRPVHTHITSILFITVFIIMASLCGTAMSATVAPSQAVISPPALSVILNDQQLRFNEVAPIIENGRTLVPLRAIFEAMGATVDWDPATGTATATRGNTTVVLPLNSTQPTVNGVVWKLDVPSRIVGGRTLAPLAFVGRAFGGNVGWDEVNRTVNIQAPVKDGSRVVAVTVGKDGVNLRSGADRSFPSVDFVLPGERLNVLGEQNGWYQVNRGSKNAWVAGWVVDVSWQEAAPVTPTPPPVVTVPPEPIPDFITGVERSTFGTSGEKITISSTVALAYTSSQTGTSLELVLNNVLPGKAQASYNYDSRLISSMEFNKKTAGSVNQTVLTLTTSQPAKFAVGMSSDLATLNIMFIEQSEIQARIPMVVLDAGHGGKDQGASGASLNEKDVNLAVVLKVGELLTQKGIKVVYTRQDDTYVSLDERTSMANLYNAAVFVSLHNNANLSPDPSGTETYCYYPMENPQLYLQKDERFNLATRLQQALVGTLGRNDRGVKQANFAVLRNTVMPSALIEMAFISNPIEEELLKQQQFRDLAAQAIADGIEVYMKENIKS